MVGFELQWFALLASAAGLAAKNSSSSMPRPLAVVFKVGRYGGRVTADEYAVESSPLWKLGVRTG